VGKKTLAKYMAMLILCKNGGCGECRDCRRIETGVHPDVIMPERTGKKRIYTRETVRKMCADMHTAPNDCDGRVYILTDCEGFEENTQNLTLKAIEEPPDHVYFIFTAQSKDIFLPTILSRVITLGVSESSPEECYEALSDMGLYAESQIREAIEVCHGNIGDCKEYLDGGEIAASADHCRKIINALTTANEYELLKALNGIGDNREKLVSALSMARKSVRDACALKAGAGKVIGCYRSGAEKLAERISYRRAETVYESMGKAITNIKSNATATAAMSALAGQIV
jgi:DNA polymerase-3 subunit delta'